MDFIRQRDLVNQNKIEQTAITLIGCGALGSASAMALSKMGVSQFTLYDDDIITEENLPNQMYRIDQLGQAKVVALTRIISEYNNQSTFIHNNQKFCILDNIRTPVIIVTTDSMSSRKLVWEKFIQESQCKCLIEARMGAEEGQVYTIIKKEILGLTPSDQDFYIQRLYPDSEAIQAPCTAKAIIYNVFMIGGLVARSFKAYVHQEKYPREVVMSWRYMDKRSFMIKE